METPPPTPPRCRACDAPLTEGQRFCRSCGSPVAEAAVTPAPPQFPPPTTPAVASVFDQPPRRGRKKIALAAVAILLLGGAGAGAAVILSGGDSDEEPRAERAPGVSPQSAPETAIATSTVPAATPPDQTDTTATSGRPAAGTAGAAPTPGTAADAMYRHWNDIAAGDYDSAYDAFHPTYATSRGDWIADKEASPPDVDAQSIVVRDTGRMSGRAHRVYVKVVTHDPGQSRCNRASGEVLVERSGGAWQYRPGELTGPSSFTVAQQAVPRSDERCARIR